LHDSLLVNGILFFSCNQIHQQLLLSGEKTNQSHFQEFLFHLIEVIVSIDFAHKKKYF